MFSWLAKTGGVERDEMLRTFNCGIGMIAVVAPEKVDAVLEALKAHGEQAVRLGTMVSRADAGVVYQGTLAL